MRGLHVCESEVSHSNISSSNIRSGTPEHDCGVENVLRLTYEWRACISLNMSLAAIACLSDFFFSILSAAFWCLKMCRQRKVNTDIVPLNKRASPCISNRCLCGGVFSSGGSLGISLTMCLCVWESAHMQPCVLPVWVSGVEGGCRWGCVDTLQQREQCAGLTVWQPSELYSWTLGRKYFFSQALCQQS